MTSKRATTDDLETERAYPMCVSNSGLLWHMAQAAVYVDDGVLKKKNGSIFLKGQCELYF